MITYVQLGDFCDKVIMFGRQDYFAEGKTKTRWVSANFWYFLVKHRIVQVRYLPDLSLCNLFLFPLLKLHFKGDSWKHMSYEKKYDPQFQTTGTPRVTFFRVKSFSSFVKKKKKNAEKWK